MFGKLGESHPDTLTAMGNIAVIYDKLGRSQEASSLREAIYKLIEMY